MPPEQAPSYETAQPTKRPIAGIVGTVVIFALAAALLFRMVLGGGSVAPTPEFMPTTTNLASMQFSDDKPVVAIVTADWCPPCQALKKNALTDARVVEFLASEAQAVMIDGTDTGAASETLQQLGVRVFPSTVVVRNGKPVATLEGNMSADRYLAWLEGQL
ncbi:MAG: thioredoxin family protein [Phycisphaerales bacterium]